MAGGDANNIYSAITPPSIAVPCPVSLGKKQLGTAIKGFEEPVYCVCVPCPIGVPGQLGQQWQITAPRNT